MLLVVPTMWVAWGAAWLRRIELRRRASPTVAALGLSFCREGWRARVVARGQVDGVRVDVRWRMRWGGVRVDARVAPARRWAVAPPDDVEGWVRATVALR